MTITLFLVFIGALARIWLGWIKKNQRHWRITSFAPGIDPYVLDCNGDAVITWYMDSWQRMDLIYSRAKPDAPAINKIIDETYPCNSRGGCDF